MPIVNFLILNYLIHIQYFLIIHALFLSSHANACCLQDVKQDIMELYPAEEIGQFVHKALEMSLEKKEGAQEKIGLLLSSLMDYNLFTPDVIVEQ